MSRPQTAQDARVTIAYTRPKAMAHDGEFFASIEVEQDKLEKSQAHPADWRRLRGKLSSYAASLAEKAPFTPLHQAAFDNVQARIAFCDARLPVAEIAHGGRQPDAGSALTARPSRNRDASQGDEHTAAFAQFLRAPHSNQTQAALIDAEMTAAQRGGIRAAGNTLTGPGGGFAVPQLVHDNIAERVKDISPLRQLATVYGVTSTGTRFLVSRNNATSAWVGETDERAGTGEPTLDNRGPTYGTVMALVEATEELLLDSAVDITAWFTSAVTQQLAQAEGAAFVSGDGTNKPTGFLAGPTPVTTGDATRASGTLQYVPSEVTDTTLATFGEAFLDSLTSLFFSAKAMHRASGVWMMNSATASIVAKIKDGEGRHIWQQSLAVGVPSTLLGRPVVIAEDMPNWGANNFPIAFGNFAAGYVIADQGELRITVDDNMTKPGYVRWYVRRRVGGIIYDSEAIKLLKVSAT